MHQCDQVDHAQNAKESLGWNTGSDSTLANNLSYYQLPITNPLRPREDELNACTVS